MRSLLWIDNTPYSTMDPRCQPQFLLHWAVHTLLSTPDDLEALDQGGREDIILELVHGKSLEGLPGVKFYWETRVTPRLVRKERLDILLPKLGLKLPPTNSKLLLCSDRRIVNE